jgi:hypothetical protein
VADNLNPRSTVVRLACSVRGAVVIVVLVVLGETAKVWAEVRVFVAAFDGLNGFAGLDG